MDPGRRRPTLLFIHGAWVTARCWDPFVGYFSARGYTCVAPPWPFHDAEPRALRAAPPPGLRGLGVRDIVDHYAALIRAEPEPPILIGHSFGGLFVQLLLGQRLGRAGVALDPAPPRGVFALYPSAVRSNLGVLLRWSGWNAVVPVSFPAFAYGFLNTLAPAEQRATYDEHAVPETGRIFFEAAFALLQRRSPVTVDFTKADRAPLLLTAGTRDHNVVMPMVRATAARYRISPARTELRIFDGRSHWLLAEPGWEAVAASVEEWLATI